MKIQKGIVKYKDRNDIVCTYGVTDDGRQYYFLDETDSKKFTNGNRIATTALVEAVDPMVKASNVGVIDNDGNVVVMFDNRSIKPITDDIILAEKANPITQSVIDANNLRSDPSSATVLVSTPATIKERLNTQMGVEGRYIFNDQFSEATLYDINGNNLVNGEYYSFIATANDKLYMSKNTVDSVINEMPLNSSNVYTNEAIDVNSVSVDPNVVEDALQQEANNEGYTDTMNNTGNGFDTAVQDNSNLPTSGVDNLVPESTDVMANGIDNNMSEQMINQNVENVDVANQSVSNNNGEMTDTFFGVSDAATNLDGSYPIPGDAVDNTAEGSMSFAQSVENDIDLTGVMTDNNSIGFGAPEVENENVNLNNANGFSSEEIANDVMASSLVPETQDFNSVQGFESNMALENNQNELVSSEAMPIESGVETSDVVVPTEDASNFMNMESSDDASGMSQVEENSMPMDIEENANVSDIAPSVEVDTNSVNIESNDDMSSVVYQSEEDAMTMNVEENNVSDEPIDSVVVEENDDVSALSQVDETTMPTDIEESSNKDSSDDEITNSVNDDVDIDVPPIVEEEDSQEFNSELISEDSSVQDDEQEVVVDDSVEDELISNNESSQEDDSKSLISMDEDDSLSAADSVIKDEEIVDNNDDVEHTLENVDFEDRFEDVVNDGISTINDTDDDLIDKFNDSSKLDSYRMTRDNYDYLSGKENSIDVTYYDKTPSSLYNSSNYTVPVRGSNQYSMYSDNYDSVFKSSMIKPDRIVSSPYNSFGGYKSQDDNSSIMSDVARSMAELMRQNKEQRGTILQYQEKLEEVESQRRVISEKYNDQTLRVESLSNKLRTIDDASTRLESKAQMLEGRLREQEKIIAAQERELNMLRPQLEGRQDLIKILADAKALLGADDEYQEDPYYGRRVS